MKRKALLLLPLIFLCGCSWIQGLTPPIDKTPLDVVLIYQGQQYNVVQAHPLDSVGGLEVSLRAEESHYVNWGDGGPNEHSSGSVYHVYESAGEFEILCWTDSKEKSFRVIAENQRPMIGNSLLYNDSLLWRDAVAVWLNPSVSGCDSSTGNFLYERGILDPDGDETRVRIRVDVVREWLVNDIPSRHEVIKECTVYSIHDRSVITNQWADVWGFWFSVGHQGMHPPYPFATIPYSALAPDYTKNEPFALGSVGPMAWPMPDWPDPGCTDCDDEDTGTEDPEAGDPEAGDVEEEQGQCFVRIIIQVIDRWGGYYGLTWLYPAPCSDNHCSTPDPSMPNPSPPIPCN